MRGASTVEAFSAIIGRMGETVALTIVFEPSENGWIVASIPEVQGVHSQGRTRDEARAMVLSALQDWLRFSLADQPNGAVADIPANADTEPIHLTFAA
jgi:predicted RNase H-like HicB family nuclease